MANYDNYEKSTASGQFHTLKSRLDILNRTSGDICQGTSGDIYQDSTELYSVTFDTSQSIVASQWVLCFLPESTKTISIEQVYKI